MKILKLKDELDKETDKLKKIRNRVDSESEGWRVSEFCCAYIL